MAKKHTRYQAPRHPLPKPPSPMPWFTIGSIMLLWGLYSLFQGWQWMGWIVLALAPFISAILPMEISDFLRRKRICEHIRRDFLDQTESSDDHSRFLAALHEDRLSSGRSGRVEPDWSTSTSGYHTANSTS